MAAPPTASSVTMRTNRLVRVIARADAGLGDCSGPAEASASPRATASCSEPARCVEELVTIDVGVARDGREVGVTEVFGDEAGVTKLLTEPGRRGVAQRVGGDMLLDTSALRGAADDVGEDRLVQASAGKTADDWVGRCGLARVAELQQLIGELSRQRLTSRLAALPLAYEQRPPSSVELEVPPARASRARSDEGRS